MARTLCITNDFPPRAGGIQAFVHGVLTRQPEGSVVVYAPSWKGAEEFDAAQPFPVVRHNTSLMVPEPFVIKKAREIAAEFECDRLVFGATAPLGLIAPTIPGITHSVGITHGHEAAWAQTPGAKQVLRRIGDGLSTVTYLGEYTRSRIAAALSDDAASRMRQLVPCVDTEAFDPSNAIAGAELRQKLGLADRKVIVCVSRLMPRKGQDTLIRVLPRVRAQIPDAALLIVGGGPYREKLTELVTKTEQEDHVVITGGVPWKELPTHYAAGHVFAMPCRTRNKGLDVEGLGIVYLEGSATGLPVIAGNSGGAPDAVKQGETGFVVANDDELVARLVELLTDEQLARELGAKGRTWVEQKWTWQRSADRLLALLEGRDPDAEGI